MTQTLSWLSRAAVVIDGYWLYGAAAHAYRHGYQVCHWGVRVPLGSAIALDPQACM